MRTIGALFIGTLTLTACPQPNQADPIPEVNSRLEALESTSTTALQSEIDSLKVQVESLAAALDTLKANSVQLLPASETLWTVGDSSDFPTLNEAFEAAGLVRIPIGGTLTIALSNDLTTTEELTISHPDGARIVLDGSDFKLNVNDGVAIAISSGATLQAIRNLEIDGGASAVTGLFVDSNASVTLDDVVLTHFTGPGIDIYTGGSVAASTLTSSNNYTGVNLRQNATLLVTELLTTNNNSFDGLGLYWGSTASVSLHTSNDNANNGVTAAQNSGYSVETSGIYNNNADVGVNVSFLSVGRVINSSSVGSNITNSVGIASTHGSHVHTDAFTSSQQIADIYLSHGSSLSYINATQDASDLTALVDTVSSSMDALPAEHTGVRYGSQLWR